MEIDCSQFIKSDECLSHCDCSWERYMTTDLAYCVEDIDRCKHSFLTNILIVIIILSAIFCIFLYFVFCFFWLFRDRKNKIIYDNEDKSLLSDDDHC